jgi:small subunit ribosomal protein S17
MAKKKSELTEETTGAVVETAQGSEAQTEVKAEVAEGVEGLSIGSDPSDAEEKPKRGSGGRKKADEGISESAESKTATNPEGGDETGVASVKGKRAEKIGVVTSDKMTKTVVVRVDRLVKHPIYRKYVKKRKKFMAHDEKGAKIGDKVRIVETRPLSARKRWRVVEIIQKAEL